MTEKILQLNTEKNIFWTLVGILFICAAFYIYSINVTIHNIVVRQDLENQASQLNLTIGSNEFQYISMRSKITIQLAYSMGFKDVSEKTFISRNSTAVVSFLSH